jgi:predicted restriction endonuclease
VKRTHAHRCQICGERLELKGGYYSEAHHVKPLGRGGLDVTANIMCVCPNHHALLDHGAIPLDPKSLRKADHHEVAQENIDYHNREIYRG